MTFLRNNEAVSNGGRRIPPHVLLIVIFWICQFGFLSAQRRLVGSYETLEMLIPRSIMAVAGMSISFGINHLHRRMGGRPWTMRLGAAVGCAVGGALLHSLANYLVFQLWMPVTNARDGIAFYFGALVAWIWVYSAISALLLAMAYSDESRERERRLAEWQGLAHSAQMRALRYQLNPHFMFNTLNSIASLIASGEGASAEQMVENLSDFLRAGLALDPNDDLTLERELELQSLYLSIEAIRFADRLRVEMDLPEALREVRVPSLILQPLVENAVKHGVARSDGPVTIAVSARQEGERLVLMVRNGVHGSPCKPGGTGIGLINTVRRLELRYGDGCDFQAGPGTDHEYLVSFSIPVQRGDG